MSEIEFPFHRNIHFQSKLHSTVYREDVDVPGTSACLNVEFPENNELIALEVSCHFGMGTAGGSQADIRSHRTEEVVSIVKSLVG